MSPLLLNIGVVLLFILLGGFFAAAEIALVSLRESQVDRLAQAGRRGRRLRALTADPNRFLAAVQVGVTLAGFVSAGFGASQIAPSIEPWLVGLGLAPAVAGTVAFIAVTVVIAYFSLVLGELAPKRLALQRAESVAMAFAAPVDWLARISRPFIWLLSRSTDVVVRMLGGDPGASKEIITGEELRGMVAAHQELSAEERELIDDVFAVGERDAARGHGAPDRGRLPRRRPAREQGGSDRRRAAALAVPGHRRLRRRRRRVRPRARHPRPGRRVTRACGSATSPARCCCSRGPSGSSRR